MANWNFWLFSYNLFSLVKPFRKRLSLKKYRFFLNRFYSDLVLPRFQVWFGLVRFSSTAWKFQSVLSLNLEKFSSPVINFLIWLKANPDFLDFCFSFFDNSTFPVGFQRWKHGL